MLLLSLLVWVQVATIAHASLFDDGPHDHNGIQCELAAFSHNHVVVEPEMPVVPSVLPRLVVAPLVIVDAPAWLQPPGRAPPPRSPPSSLH